MLMQLVGENMLIARRPVASALPAGGASAVKMEYSSVEEEDVADDVTVEDHDVEDFATFHHSDFASDTVLMLLADIVIVEAAAVKIVKMVGGQQPQGA